MGVYMLSFGSNSYLNKLGFMQVRTFDETRYRSAAKRWRPMNGRGLSPLK